MGTIFNLVGLNGYAPSERELLRQRASGADEKKREALLNERIKTIQKHKIYEDVHSLLFSSGKIGQVETTLEKRRRAMQLSKVGLMVPHDDQPSKKRGREGDSDQTKELSSKNYVADVPKDGVNPLRPCNYKETQSTTSMRQKIDLIDPKVDCENLADSCTPRPQTCPFIVHVFRPNDVEEKMKGLPIVMMEQEIMEAIKDNSTIIILWRNWFLYEAGYGSSDFNATKGIIALDDLLVVGYNSNGGGAYDVNTVLRLISHCLDSDDLLYQVGKDVAESLQHALINRGLNFTLQEALQVQGTKHRELTNLKEAFDGFTVETESSMNKLIGLEQAL
ncbi:hypothetical protein Sjap_004641 [Stephania japonica]|uniref:Uncharacterized protein n=1 Tax=Stephania japonica TaxID=461633 RepID=A0AAP0K442_9MAGN